MNRRLALFVSVLDGRTRAGRGLLPQSLKARAPTRRASANRNRGPAAPMTRRKGGGHSSGEACGARSPRRRRPATDDPPPNLATASPATSWKRYRYQPLHGSCPESEARPENGHRRVDLRRTGTTPWHSDKIARPERWPVADPRLPRRGHARRWSTRSSSSSPTPSTTSLSIRVRVVARRRSRVGGTLSSRG